MDHTSLFARYTKRVSALQALITSRDSGTIHTREEKLQRSRAFLKTLGNPQDQLRIVHVAGTAGKGSTATMIAHMLYAHGESVGLYTSPFVTTTLENIWVNGQLCDPELFITTVDKALQVRASMEENLRPGYAETLFAIGVLCCVTSGCTRMVVEAGCGGRFDYTNVFTAPTTCVLTPIGHDHTELLGNTLPEIAWHKAGIIHSRCEVWSAEQPSEVRAVFEAEVHAQHAHMHLLLHHATHGSHALGGAHQNENARLAASVAHGLGVSDEAITRGLDTFMLAARCEIMQHDPLVIIDGAHSPIKMEALVQFLHTQRYTTLRVIYSSKYTKDPYNTIAPLIPFITELWCSEFHLPGFSSHNAEVMQTVIAQHAPALSIHTCPDPCLAYAEALAHSTPQDCIVITGSLYLAGIVRAHLISERAIVEHRSITGLS